MATIGPALMLLPGFAIFCRDIYYPATNHIRNSINGERPWLIA
jgi:hypothetical protein